VCAWTTHSTVLLVYGNTGFGKVTLVVSASTTDLFGIATPEFTANRKLVAINLLGGLSDDESSLMECLKLPPFV
jgi:hypothetical protein